MLAKKRKTLWQYPLALSVVAVLWLASAPRASAVYSLLDGAPTPSNARQHLLQPFTSAEWKASSFASQKELQWFRDAKYGMFIHFGLSTRKNMELSWGMCKTRKAPDTGEGPIADAEWQSWPQHFKFEKFDAQKWVRTAKESGFKYVVLIAKHHDGFHLWDTAHSDFKVTNTPFGRDLVKEVVDACHQAKMPIGIYYSQRDWYHPDYMPVDPQKVTRNEFWWKLKPGFNSPMGDRHQKYLEYQEKAVRELCTKYGKIDIFWWDAAWWGGMFTAEMWDGERINRLVRKLQPGIVINNRCSIPGDFDTPEQELGVFQNWRAWESCISLTPTWSYSGGKPKSRSEIIRMIVNNACGDGNVLLSWGPQWNGSFAKGEEARLLDVGKWMKENGQAVYDTRGGPWKPANWGGSVYQGNKVYLHVLHLDGETLKLPQLPNCRVLSAQLLQGKKIAFKQEKGTIVLTIPKSLRSMSDTIVELKMNQPMEGVQAISGGKRSIFTDQSTYGSVISYDAGVKVNSPDSAVSQRAKRGPKSLVDKSDVEHFSFLTTKETQSWVDIDLRREFAVTGLRIGNAKMATPYTKGVLKLLLSTDGETWHEAWKITESDQEAEIPVMGFHAGALVAGRQARYLRLVKESPEKSAFSLRKIKIFGK